ncbi:hypothetical protein I317_05592 [Kwoniella heveanensis CBS 569]|nr:hypothetical protein I317_05592 [Kwoniella heveanensis CBS 569]
MFAVPSTPARQTRSSNSNAKPKSNANGWSTGSAYNSRGPHTPTPNSSLFQQNSLTQSSTPPPNQNQNQTTSDSTSSPVQTRFVPSSELQRTSPPPSLDRQLHTSPMQPPYPNTPSPQPSFGINGTIIVNEPASIMQSHSTHASSDCGTSDVFIASQALPKPSSQRPALRPSLSHNALLNTPSPASASTWPRRVMTTGSALSASLPSAPAPSVHFSAPSAVSENNSNMATTGAAHHQNQHHHHLHEANTPFLSHSTSSSTSNASSTANAAATQPHPYASHPSYQSYNNNNTNTSSSSYPHADSPSTYPYDSTNAYPSSSAWAMTTVVNHPHHQQQQSPYHWGMHHMAIPSKQDEPILAPGELPAPRPPMSYAALIGEALLLAPPPHQLYVSEISDSIKKRYPYYRQNPTKIYNGVRHQTSMCKAFVKLPRPFGDQSGGARKWAIRAGCEGWFAGGGYHPPTSSATTTTKTSKNGGKAKVTARSKQLIIGTNEDKKGRDVFFPNSGSSGEGPSSGPAYDGTSRPLIPYSQPYAPASYAAPAPPPQNGHAHAHSHSHGHMAPGYHYVPIPPAHGHPQPTQPIYVPVWGPYATANAVTSYASQGQVQGHPGYAQQYNHPGSQSPEQGTWRGVNGVDAQSNDGTHVSSSYEEVKMVGNIGSPAPSVHSLHGSIHSSHGASPETM